MKYYLISDSKSIIEDIEYLKKHSTQHFTKDGIIIIDAKVRLMINGMDTISLDLVK